MTEFTQAGIAGAVHAEFFAPARIGAFAALDRGAAAWTGRQSDDMVRARDGGA